jgi:cleavage and polyadenylation specificity factor subunit 1
LSEFPSITQPFDVQSSPSHGVQHAIVTNGRPTTAKFRRLDPVRLAAAKSEFQKMLEAGVVRRSGSCWSSPLHMVQKKGGGWRPCGDFWRLNNATTDDKYPLPNMGDLSSRLDGCVIFSKLDLQKGYFQVPVAPEDVHKTAIITPFGLFEFLRMPFGLKNAGMTFQRLMDKIFSTFPSRSFTWMISSSPAGAQMSITATCKKFFIASTPTVWYSTWTSVFLDSRK